MLEIKEKYQVSKYCESIIKNKRAILYHKLYGKTIKISEECWKVIKENLDAGYLDKRNLADVILKRKIVCS
ncbi:MAG: hypothetical protein IJA10_14625 [Lachnospiraceae bacterium]|nr:hypothetical protein [Lachnospiraceae bacterium]